MRIEVIESFVIARSEDAECHDKLVVTPNHAAIVDGAGDPFDLSVSGVPAGLFAASVIVEGIRQLPGGADAHNAIRLLSDRLARATARSEASPPSTGTRPTASAVIYSAPKRQVWRIGTGWIAYDGYKSRGTQEVEDVRTAYRSALIKGQRALAPPAEMPSTLLAFDDPLHQVQHAFQNRATGLGYGVIDGTRVPAGLLEVVDVPEDTDEIILASDGYPAVAPTLEETEALLAQDIQEDPLRIGPNGGTKSSDSSGRFDDCAYLRLLIT